MKFLLKISLLIFLFSSFVQSQDFNLVKQAVGKLDNRIVTLDHTASKYHLSKVQEILVRAKAELNQCESLLYQFHIRQAWTHYKKAEKLVDLSAKVILVKPALKLNAEMEKLFLKAERVVQKSDRSEGRYLLTRARAFRAKAEQSYRSNRFIRGQEFQRIAIYFVSKAIEITSGNSALNQSQDYQQLVENLHNLYNDLSAAPDKVPGLKTLLQKAASGLQQAQKNFEKGRLKEAYIQLQISERLLYRAADLSQDSGKGRREQIENNLLSLDHYIGSIAESTGENTTIRDKQLLRKARKFLRAARRDFEQKDYAKSELKINLAQRMASKVLRFNRSQDMNSSADTDQRISEVRQLMELQKTKLNAQNKEIIQILHSNANKLLNSAEQDQAADRPGRAIKKTRLALRLVNRVEAILARNKVADTTESRLAQRYTQIKRLLDNLSHRQDNENISMMLPLLNRLLEKADRAEKSGILYIADELFDFIQRQINRLIKSAAH